MSKAIEDFFWEALLLQASDDVATRVVVQGAWYTKISLKPLLLISYGYVITGAKVLAAAFSFIMLIKLVKTTIEASLKKQEVANVINNSTHASLVSSIQAYYKNTLTKTPCSLWFSKLHNQPLFHSVTYIGINNESLELRNTHNTALTFEKMKKHSHLSVKRQGEELEILNSSEVSSFISLTSQWSADKKIVRSVEDKGSLKKKRRSKEEKPTMSDKVEPKEKEQSKDLHSTQIGWGVVDPITTDQFKGEMCVYPKNQELSISNKLCDILFNPVDKKCQGDGKTIYLRFPDYRNHTKTNGCPLELILSKQSAVNVEEATSDLILGDMTIIRNKYNKYGEFMLNHQHQQARFREVISPNKKPIPISRTVDKTKRILSLIKVEKLEDKTTKNEISAIKYQFDFSKKRQEEKAAKEKYQTQNERQKTEKCVEENVSTWQYQVKGSDDPKTASKCQTSGTIGGKIALEVNVNVVRQDPKTEKKVTTVQTGNSILGDLYHSIKSTSSDSVESRGTLNSRLTSSSHITESPESTQSFIESNSASVPSGKRKHRTSSISCSPKETTSTRSVKNLFSGSLLKIDLKPPKRRLCHDPTSNSQKTKQQTSKSKSRSIYTLSSNSTLRTCTSNKNIAHPVPSQKKNTFKEEDSNQDGITTDNTHASLRCVSSRKLSSRGYRRLDCQVERKMTSEMLNVKPPPGKPRMLRDKIIDVSKNFLINKGSTNKRESGWDKSSTTTCSVSRTPQPSSEDQLKPVNRSSDIYCRRYRSSEEEGLSNGTISQISSNVIKSERSYRSIFDWKLPRRIITKDNILKVRYKQNGSQQIGSLKMQTTGQSSGGNFINSAKRQLTDKAKSSHQEEASAGSTTFDVLNCLMESANKLKQIYTTSGKCKDVTVGAMRSRLSNAKYHPYLAPMSQRMSHHQVKGSVLNLIMCDKCFPCSNHQTSYNNLLQNDHPDIKPLHSTGHDLSTKQSSIKNVVKSSNVKEKFNVPGYMSHQIGDKVYGCKLVNQGNRYMGHEFAKEKTRLLHQRPSLSVNKIVQTGQKKLNSSSFGMNADSPRKLAKVKKRYFLKSNKNKPLINTISGSQTENIVKDKSQQFAKHLIQCTPQPLTQPSTTGDSAHLKSSGGDRTDLGQKYPVEDQVPTDSTKEVLKNIYLVESQLLGSEKPTLNQGQEKNVDKNTSLCSSLARQELRSNFEETHTYEPKPKVLSPTSIVSEVSVLSQCNKEVPRRIPTPECTICTPERNRTVAKGKFPQMDCIPEEIIKSNQILIKKNDEKNPDKKCVIISLSPDGFKVIYPSLMKSVDKDKLLGLQDCYNETFKMDVKGKQAQEDCPSKLQTKKTRLVNRGGLKTKGSHLMKTGKETTKKTEVRKILPSRIPRYGPLLKVNHSVTSPVSSRLSSDMNRDNKVWTSFQISGLCEEKSPRKTKLAKSTHKLPVRYKKKLTTDATSELDNATGLLFFNKVGKHNIETLENVIFPSSGVKKAAQKRGEKPYVVVNLNSKVKTQDRGVNKEDVDSASYFPFGQPLFANDNFTKECTFLNDGEHFTSIENLDMRKTFFLSDCSGNEMNRYYDEAAGLANSVELSDSSKEPLNKNTPKMLEKTGLCITNRLSHICSPGACRLCVTKSSESLTCGMGKAGLTTSHQKYTMKVQEQLLFREKMFRTSKYKDNSEDYSLQGAMKCIKGSEVAINPSFRHCVIAEHDAETFHKLDPSRDTDYNHATQLTPHKTKQNQESIAGGRTLSVQNAMFSSPAIGNHQTNKSKNTTRSTRKKSIIPVRQKNNARPITTFAAAVTCKKEATNEIKEVSPVKILTYEDYRIRSKESELLLVMPSPEKYYSSSAHEKLDFKTKLRNLKLNKSESGQLKYAFDKKFISENSRHRQEKMSTPMGNEEFVNDPAGNRRPTSGCQILEKKSTFQLDIAKPTASYPVCGDLETQSLLDDSSILDKILTEKQDVKEIKDKPYKMDKPINQNFKAHNPNINDKMSNKNSAGVLKVNQAPKNKLMANKWKNDTGQHFSRQKINTKILDKLLEEAKSPAKKSDVAFKPEKNLLDTKMQNLLQGKASLTSKAVHQTTGAHETLKKIDSKSQKSKTITHESFTRKKKDKKPVGSRKDIKPKTETKVKDKAMNGCKISQENRVEAKTQSRDKANNIKTGKAPKNVEKTQKLTKKFDSQKNVFFSEKSPKKILSFKYIDQELRTCNQSTENPTTCFKSSLNSPGFLKTKASLYDEQTKHSKFVMQQAHNLTNEINISKDFDEGTTISLTEDEMLVSSSIDDLRLKKQNLFSFMNSERSDNVKASISSNMATHTNQYPKATDYEFIVDNHIKNFLNSLRLQEQSKVISQLKIWIANRLSQFEIDSESSTEAAISKELKLLLGSMNKEKLRSVLLNIHLTSEHLEKILEVDEMNAETAESMKVNFLLSSRREETNETAQTSRKRSDEDSVSVMGKRKEKHDLSNTSAINDTMTHYSNIPKQQPVQGSERTLAKTLSNLNLELQDRLEHAKINTKSQYENYLNFKDEGSQNIRNKISEKMRGLYKDKHLSDSLYIRDKTSKIPHVKKTRSSIALSPSSILDLCRLATLDRFNPHQKSDLSNKLANGKHRKKRFPSVSSISCYDVGATYVASSKSPPLIQTNSYIISKKGGTLDESLRSLPDGLLMYSSTHTGFWSSLSRGRLNLGPNISPQQLQLLEREKRIARSRAASSNRDLDEKDSSSAEILLSWLARSPDLEVSADRAARQNERLNTMKTLRQAAVQKISSEDDVITCEKSSPWLENLRPKSMSPLNLKDLDYNLELDKTSGCHNSMGIDNVITWPVLRSLSRDNGLNESPRKHKKVSGYIKLPNNKSDKFSAWRASPSIENSNLNPNKELDRLFRREVNESFNNKLGRDKKTVLDTSHPQPNSQESSDVSNSQVFQCPDVVSLCTRSINNLPQCLNLLSNVKFNAFAGKKFNTKTMINNQRKSQKKAPLKKKYFPSESQYPGKMEKKTASACYGVMKMISSPFYQHVKKVSEINVAASDHNASDLAWKESISVQNDNDMSKQSDDITAGPINFHWYKPTTHNTTRQLLAMDASENSQDKHEQYSLRESTYDARRRRDVISEFTHDTTTLRDSSPFMSNSTQNQSQFYSFQRLSQTECDLVCQSSFHTSIEDQSYLPNLKTYTGIYQNLAATKSHNDLISMCSQTRNIEDGSQKESSKEVDKLWHFPDQLCQSSSDKNNYVFSAINDSTLQKQSENINIGLGWKDSKLQDKLSPNYARRNRSFQCTERKGSEPSLNLMSVRLDKDHNPTSQTHLSDYGRQTFDDCTMTYVKHPSESFTGCHDSSHASCSPNRPSRTPKKYSPAASPPTLFRDNSDRSGPNRGKRSLGFSYLYSDDPIGVRLGDDACRPNCVRTRRPMHNTMVGQIVRMFESRLQFQPIRY